MSASLTNCGRFNRVFQTRAKLDNSGNPTSEEFHYAFDGWGRLAAADFALTPQSGQSGYSASYPAASRARAWYDYDQGGKLIEVEHYWDTWNSGTQAYNTSVKLLKASYAYDPFKGVKTSSTWKQNVSGNWSTERAETYGYSQDIEWLATVTSGGSSRTWDYDAAGNRISDTAAAGTWTYDALNRMTASPNLTYTNDILGNRLTRSGGTTSYTWDLVNRMSSFTSGGVTRTYEYRADGMRMKKTLASSTVDYFYDGQMPIEERITAGTTVTSVQNAIGARGIDLITKSVVVNNGTPTVTKAYPIYDGHGNVVGTVSSSGTLADRRLYGPWGNVLSGASTGLPNERFCANLGHLQDDESGLTYMRARYYEMGTGRFISEDVAKQGLNWALFTGNNPVNAVDPSGQFHVTDSNWFGLWVAIGYDAVLCAWACAAMKMPGGTLGCLLLAVEAFSGALNNTDISSSSFNSLTFMTSFVTGAGLIALKGIARGLEASVYFDIDKKAAILTAGYAIMLLVAVNAFNEGVDLPQ